jgi:hypothetical protein
MVTVVNFQQKLISGASGAGYQSSWGMAIKAVELLEEALKSQ